MDNGKYMNKTSFSILIIEDHQDLAANLGDFLEEGGFTVDFADNGLSALHLVTENIYDAIVLDIMMPGINGYDVCRKIRDDVGLDIPIIMLTAMDTLENKLEGFGSGADDYLVKPFAMKELEARLIALIKRHRKEVNDAKIEISGLIFDPKVMQVTRNEDILKVSPTGIHILKVLMRESPNLVSREKLEAEVWGDELPNSDAFRSHLYNLRKVVDKPYKIELIHTISGLGYKLCLPEKV
jgi:DNA-binding response OmpR family regulator